MGKLDGKVALITGGARGQGRSHALALAQEGADVVVCDIAAQIETVPYALGTEAELATTAELVESIGRRALGVQVDVRNLADLEQLAKRVVAEFGQIDILLANAGISSYGSVADLSAQQWQDMIDVNVTGVFNSCKAVVPHMTERGYGRIVATSSIAGRMGTTNSSHYAAAKWGVLGLVKSLALEVMQHGITVNAIAPSGVQTPMIMNDFYFKKIFRPDLDEPTEADVLPIFEQGQYLPGLVQPSDISNAILYLVTDTGRYHTGEVLEVSGGMSAALPT